MNSIDLRRHQTVMLGIALLFLGVSLTLPNAAFAERKATNKKQCNQFSTETWERQACEDCVGKGSTFLSNENAMACKNQDGAWAGCSKKEGGECKTGGGGPGGRIGDLRIAPPTSVDRSLRELIESASAPAAPVIKEPATPTARPMKPKRAITPKSPAEPIPTQPPQPMPTPPQMPAVPMR